MPALSFLVEQDAAGTVTFGTRGFLRPRPRPRSLLLPPASMVDKHLVRRYLRALPRHVAAPP
jgi:uncharacterized protein (UPF0548 family)